MNTREFIEAALQEDAGNGDHSTLASIPAQAQGKAVLKIKENGIIAGIDLAAEKLKAAGVKRVIKLPVGGAFHSPLMEPAREELAAVGVLFACLSEMRVQLKRQAARKCSRLLHQPGRDRER